MLGRVRKERAMKSFAEYLKERFMVDDPDEIVRTVAEYLDDKADEIEKTEPYATKTIERIRSAAREVREIEYDE